MVELRSCYVDVGFSALHINGLGLLGYCGYIAYNL
jgi:hypothetical protein